jgi:formylmethanofuran dehydrogenase subunit E
VTLPPFEMFTDIRQHHGHYCPMSTLGGRMGWAARQRLSADGVEGDFRATVYARTCALDGISRTTGCDESFGTLVIKMTGEHRLDLINSNGIGISVVLTDVALQAAWDYRQAGNALERERASLSSEELTQCETELAAMLDDVLQRFRTQPDKELLSFAVLATAVEG